MSEMTKNRAVFWTRFASWLGVECGIPITVFASKFGLFKKEYPICDELGNVISKPSVSLNGWGIVCCILLGGFLMSVLKEVVDAQQGYSLTKQCWVGLRKTMPLIVALAILYFLNGVIEQVIFCLIIVIICRLIATPINPLPKWKYEKQGKEEYTAASEALTNFVKNSLKRGEG